MLQRLPWCVLLVALGAGCTCGPQRGIKPRMRGTFSAPEIYLTGRVEVNAAGQEELVPLMEAISPNAPCAYNHEVRLHVHDIQGLDDHDYYVLVGPDYEKKTGMNFEVRTSTATFYLVTGWAMLVGQLPVSETDLVSTSASGTRMAIRVMKAASGSPERHYVYNLEPAGSPKKVKVCNKTTNQPPFELPPQHLAISEANVPCTSQPISTEQFLTDMRTRAGTAKFDTAFCPCP
jgi:hypothetical protein